MRWKSAALCWCVAMVAASSVSAFAQGATGEWVRPYAVSPGLWELIGRVVQDTPEARRDRTFRGFLEPSILAAGSLNPKTGTMDVLGTFVRFLPVNENNVLNVGQAPDRLVVGEVVQVRFLSLTADGLGLETRLGNPSSEFQRCYDNRHTQFAHLTDIRVQAALQCEGAIFWTFWRGRPPVMLDASGQGTLPLDELGTLTLTLDDATKTLSASIRVPPVGGGTGPRPR